MLDFALFINSVSLNVKVLILNIMINIKTISVVSHLINLCFFFRDADDKTKGSMGRLLNIWQERGVFDQDFIGNLKSVLGKFMQRLRYYWGDTGFCKGSNPNS